MVEEMMVIRIQIVRKKMSDRQTKGADGDDLAASVRTGVERKQRRTGKTRERGEECLITCHPDFVRHLPCWFLAVCHHNSLCLYLFLRLQFIFCLCRIFAVRSGIFAFSRLVSISDGKLKNQVSKYRRAGARRMDGDHMGQHGAIYLERAQKTLINTHHCASIIEFAAVIRRAEERYKLTLREELIPILNDLVSPANQVHVVFT